MLLRFSLRAIGARQRTHYRCGRDSRKPGNGYAEFSGLDVSFDASAALSLPLREPRRKKAAMPADGGELARRIAAFDLARATPLEAMNFVGELQRQLFAAEVND